MVKQVAKQSKRAPELSLKTSAILHICILKTALSLSFLCQFQSAYVALNTSSIPYPKFAISGFGSMYLHEMCSYPSFFSPKKFALGTSSPTIVHSNLLSFAYHSLSSNTHYNLTQNVKKPCPEHITFY
ncbi:hypothetical protein Lalb_Chr05g0230061 [Lupinus albus]|uniref:Uncharacterized protein n=1 Tax=Lupinus albus TaxID=3870 RepID=A0A6A4QMC9_LUPAL|nr:hypothetical protein Lalb_Chr05g0230061 [Lupinus albus]